MTAPEDEGARATPAPIYPKDYILPRREPAAALLRRAQRDGTVALDADLYPSEP
jgi:hypothetical protein